MPGSVKGFENLLRKLNTNGLLAEPFTNFFNRLGAAVQGEARRLSPVDTGRLRASITYEVDPAPVPLFVKVGTAVEYAPFMEYGTGALSDNPAGHGSGHHPPGNALNVWGQRHGGASGHAIARAIARRGGLAPRRYLRGGVEAVLPRLKEFMAKLEDDIVKSWDS